MKKALVALLAIAMVASLSFAQDEVKSVNVVGFNKVAAPGQKLVLTSVTFESFSGSTLEDLVGDQLPVGSVAYIWNRQTKGYDPASRTLRGGWVSTTPILRGDAFWLRSSDPEGTTNVVSFMGEVPDDYNDSKTNTIPGITGLDAIAYAFPVDIAWTNTTLATAMGTGDLLYIWDDANRTYQSYSKTLRGGWSSAAGVVLKAGRAFFVNTASSIDWTEIAPYEL